MISEYSGLTSFDSDKNFIVHKKEAVSRESGVTVLDISLSAGYKRYARVQFLRSVSCVENF